MPIAIELELVDNRNEAILSEFPTEDTTIAQANTSNNWEIVNCEVKVDFCTLDNALDNSYAEHLLSGKSLPINYSTYVSQVSQMTGQKSAINVARALTRLKSLIVTFKKITHPP